MNPSDPLPTSDTSIPQAPQRLCLTDFVHIRTLQELQDAFTAMTGFATTIHDAEGRQVTAPSDTAARQESARVLDWLMADEISRAKDAPLSAPIIVDDQVLGTINIDPRVEDQPHGPDLARLRDAAQQLGLIPEHVEQLIKAADRDVDTHNPARSAGVQFLYLIANNIARLCYQEYQLRKRIDELSTLYTLSTVLSQQRDLQKVLDTAAREAAETFRVKAVGIRLLDDSLRELRTQTVWNLSEAYIEKGPILLEMSTVFQQALSEGISYVADMRSDERVIYPDDAQREGIVSHLCGGMVYKGQPIGVIQLFAGEARVFSKWETDLLRAMAQLLAAAINNTRLEGKRLEQERVAGQLKMAADVQKRMLPQSLPTIPGFEVAARYVPSFELGGDFYDFIEFTNSNSLGVAIADVSGKGVAASLLMASVRSSLRAYAQDLYDLDMVISRVNQSLCRDTQANEFATLFYGVLEPRSKRLTYSNAGHEPPLLLRKGKIIRLEAGGMVVGVDPTQKFDKGILDFEKGDIVLFFTDGLMDAMNFERQRFGRERIIKALLECSRKNATDALNHVLWEMRRFAGLNPRTDDNTMIVLKCVS